MGSEKGGLFGEQSVKRKIQAPCNETMFSPNATGRNVLRQQKKRGRLNRPPLSFETATG